MGLGAGLNRCGKSRPTGIRSPDRPTRRQSLYRLRYPAHHNRFIREFIKCEPRVLILEERDFHVK